MKFTALCTLAATVVASAAVATDCGCGPLFCPGAADFPARLAAKQARLAKDGAPTRLAALLGRDGQCQGCLDNGPDGFTILNVKSNGDSYTIAWDETNERISHTKATQGELSAYYIINSRQACACCGSSKAKERSDWNPTLEMNTGLAIACHGGGATAACP